MCKKSNGTLHRTQMYQRYTRLVQNLTFNLTTKIQNQLINTRTYTHALLGISCFQPKTYTFTLYLHTFTNVIKVSLFQTHCAHGFKTSAVHIKTCSSENMKYISFGRIKKKSNTVTNLFFCNILRPSTDGNALNVCQTILKLFFITNFQSNHLSSN